MARAVPKTEITYGGKKYNVFSKVTGLVPRTESGEEAEYIIFGPERDGVANVVVLAPNDVNEEGLALRVKWFLDAKPRCVKCGAGYDGRNYVRVVAIRNGTYYLDVRCGKCEPRIEWTASIVTGKA